MRAGIYYRVSSEEQIDGFSLDAQRRILTEFCANKGWHVADEYADEGKSARGDNIEKRPQFKRMMEDAEAGVFDVVVVHKLDRFSRNIRITFDSLARLDHCGVSFTTVVEHQFDFTTPMGKVMLSLLAAFAQYYSDNLSQETKKGKAERKAQGLYNGHIPWGMMKGEGGIPVANPDTIDGLLLAFRLAAEGESDRTIAQALNEGGYRTTGVRLGTPAPFTKDTVAKMLQNRFYLGELPGERPDDALAAKHMAVIDRGIFEAAQEERERRATARGASVASGMTIYSLSGLGTCGECGGRLQIQPSNGTPRLYCSSRRQGTGCTARGVRLADLELAISEYLHTFVIPEGYRERLRAFVTEASRQAHSEGAAQRGRIERQLDRTKDLYRLGDIERGEYLAERERLQRDLAALRLHEEARDHRLTDLAYLLGSAAAGWAQANQTQRNRLARAIFTEVIVRDGTVVSARPQPEIVGFFALDATAHGADLTTFDREDAEPVTSASSIRSVDSMSTERFRSIGNLLVP